MRCQSASLVSKQTARRQRSASVCAAQCFHPEQIYKCGTRLEWTRSATYANKTLLLRFFFLKEL